MVILPGLGNAASDYTALAESLRRRGHSPVTVVPIQRWQWALNALGFFTADYWRGTLQPRPLLDWYLSCVDTTVQAVLNTPSSIDADADVETTRRINIVGHSAGGWLARVYLSEYASPEIDGEVDMLLTLGTPHAPPPPGVVDQTRGLLTYVARECSEPAPTRVVCVAGTGIPGRQIGKGTLGELVAFLSYAAVCGDGAVDGDGVTPAQAAVIPGADVVQCACAHSMLTADAWYGADAVLPLWADRLV